MIKKTIKIPLFWKIYIIVVTIVLIGFVVLWSILWTALKKYEQSRPEYAMDKITEQIQLQDTGDFTKYVHTGENAYEGSEALDEAVREYIKNVLCEGALFALISAAYWPTASLLIPLTMMMFVPSRTVSIPSGSSISTG